MVDLNEVEKAIIAKLQPLAQGLKVEAFPDRPVEYIENELQNARGALLVFVPVNAAKGDDTDEWASGFTLRPEITILHFDNRPDDAHTGAYGLLKDTVEVFDGEEGEGTYLNIGRERYKVQATGFGFVAHDTERGLWEYVVRIELRPK